MARVLVTGCAGFIGSHLAERLLDEGHEVVGIDCLTPFYEPARKADTLDRLSEHGRFEAHRIDLSRTPLDVVVEGAKVIYHLAGQPGVRQSFDEPGEYVRHNVTASRRLLHAASGAGLRAFVYASSSSIYGNANGRMRETDPAVPISVYAHTKVTTEQLARRAWREHGVPTIGLRYFSVYGPRQRPDMVFQRFLERALRGAPLPILGDGSQRRDFTYVEDIVDATIAAAERGRAGGVYNVGGGQPATLKKVISLLGELLERAPLIEYLAPAPGDVRATAADTTLARRELGFKPRTDLATGMALQLDWLLAAQPATAAA
jgi:nucleoside-diphosphate-sugar epimerase